MLSLNLKKEIYRIVWREIRAVFREGYCVYEADLQAELYRHFLKRLPFCKVVAQRKWENALGGEKKPDLVVVEEDMITDIFELKIVTQNWAEWQKDADKLKKYVSTHGPGEYPVRICPETGNWDRTARLHENCLLHFVAVCQHDAEAVSSPLEGLRERKINHWFGPVGAEDCSWGIDFWGIDIPNDAPE